MKYTLFLVLCIFATLEVKTEDVEEPCEKSKLKCVQTEYKSYIKCLEKQRTKRNTCINAGSVVPVMQPSPCSDTSCGQSQLVAPIIKQPNSQIVIDTCMNSCSGSCSGLGCQDRCDRSCNVLPQVQPNPCVNSCSASCSGLGCQDRCDHSCNILPQVQQIIQPQPQPIIQPQPQPIIQAQPQPIINIPTSPGTSSSPNITTIIKLTNIVNNTNVINVPTTINNTNINNIDLGTNSSSNQLLQSASQNSASHRCCMVVQPKVCHRLNSTSGAGYRCIHRKHHTCGPQCNKSSVVHAQIRQPCNGPVGQCPPNIAYVPQPTSQRCHYQSEWPYVHCSNDETPSCYGCYDHYGYGFDRFFGNSTPNCIGCYDDGYNTGPLYRQGPFYRPGYYHTPPCYLTGTCYMQQQTYPTNCGIYGCFGHELLDPAFGIPSYSPYATGYMPYYQFYQPQTEYYGSAPVNSEPVQTYQEAPVYTQNTQPLYYSQPIQQPVYTQYIPQYVPQYVPQPVYTQYVPQPMYPRYPYHPIYDTSEIILLNSTSLPNNTLTIDENAIIPERLKNPNFQPYPIAYDPYVMQYPWVQSPFIYVEPKKVETSNVTATVTNSTKII